MENRSSETAKQEKMTGKEKAIGAAVYTAAAVGSVGAGVLLRQAVGAAAGVCFQIMRVLLTR